MLLSFNIPVVFMSSDSWQHQSREKWFPEDVIRGEVEIPLFNLPLFNLPLFNLVRIFIAMCIQMEEFYFRFFLSFKHTLQIF